VIDTRFHHARGPPNGVLGYFHFLDFLLRCRGEKFKKWLNFENAMSQNLMGELESD
jgi:hypothetical protein